MFVFQYCWSRVLGKNLLIHYSNSNNTRENSQGLVRHYTEGLHKNFQDNICILTKEITYVRSLIVSDQNN